MAAARREDGVIASGLVKYYRCIRRQAFNSLHTKGMKKEAKGPQLLTEMLWLSSRAGYNKSHLKFSAVSSIGFTDSW